MSTPNIRYYARLEYCKDSKGTPKYMITTQTGYYPPMEELKGRKGAITFYWQEKRKEGLNVPAVWLQAKNSLNFTGLKEFYQNGELSGFAYGYPYNKPTHSKEEKKNPFYEYRGDGYLFVYDVQKVINREIGDEDVLLPVYIEMIVLEGARCLISSYCKQLQMGGFDEALNDLRKQAIPLL